MNIRKLRTWKNSNFFFRWRGPLVMIFGGMGAGGSNGDEGRGLAGSLMGQGSGGQRGQMAGRGPITTLTSHQSGILHYLIFICI